MDAGRRKIWHLMMKKYDTQLQFSHALNVNVIDINKILKGHRKINDQDCQELAVLLSCKASELSAVRDPTARKMKKIL